MMQFSLSALAGALLLSLLWLRYRRPTIGGAALLWVLYAGYEYLVAIRVLCSGDCNIRVDLLLLFPMLLIAAVGAVWSLCRVLAGK